MFCEVEVQTPGGVIEVRRRDDWSDTLEVKSAIAGTTLNGVLVTISATIPVVGKLARYEMRHYSWASSRNGGSGTSRGPVLDDTLQAACEDLVRAVRDTVVAAGTFHAPVEQTDVVIDNIHSAAVIEAIESAPPGALPGVVRQVTHTCDGVVVSFDATVGSKDAMGQVTDWLASRGIGARLHARTSWAVEPFTMPKGGLTLQPAVAG